MLTEKFPAPVIQAICDNDTIHHGRAVRAHLRRRGEMLGRLAEQPSDRRG